MAIFDDVEEEISGSSAAPAPEAPLPPITVQQMDALIATLFQQRAEAEKQKAALAEVNKDVARLEGQVAAALEQHGRKNYKTPLGAVSVVEKWRVSVPTDTAAKKKLFGFLRAKSPEVMWKYITVNSNSLTSYFMEEWGIAKERGDGLDFELPGVGPAKLHKMLQVRKA